MDVELDITIDMILMQIEDMLKCTEQIRAITEPQISVEVNSKKTCDL